MGNKVEELKKQWNNWNKSWNSIEQYNAFIEKYPKENLGNLALEEYTNIKINDNDEYFTHWLERKTEKCGKFRTASSYAYGIYKVNPNNIQDENEKKLADNKYKAFEENNKKSKDYLEESKAKEYFEKIVLPIILALANYEDIGNSNTVKTIRPLDINYARKNCLYVQYK